MNKLTKCIAGGGREGKRVRGRGKGEEGEKERENKCKAFVAESGG